MDSWIAQMCSATSRRQFVTWFFLLSTGIAFLLFNARYARNFIEGPFPLQTDDLVRITDASSTPNYYASVRGDKVVDTGIQEVTTTTENGRKTGEYVSAGYYALLKNNRVLIVKDSVAPSGTIDGELKPFPSGLSSKLFSGTDGQELKADAYPFYLDTDGFRYPGYWTIGIGLVFLVLFFKFGRRAWIRWRNVSKHPVLERVTSHWGDVVGVSVDAERELNAGVAYRSGGIFITNKYIIKREFFVFDIFRFEDMLWAYKNVIQRRFNFIPTGKSYEATLIFYGGSAQFGGPEQKIHEVLAYASNKAPWAVLGYTKEIAGIFNKRTSEFCEALEARRREIRAKFS